MLLFRKVVTDPTRRMLLYRSGDRWARVLVSHGFGGGFTVPEVTLEDRVGAGLPLFPVAGTQAPFVSLLVPPGADVYAIGVVGADFSVAVTTI